MPTTFPVRNATKGTPTPTDSTCAAVCSVWYPELIAMKWVPEVQVVYTTEVTVGTVSTIIMTSSNATVSSWTRTVYGAVPSEYSLYSQTTASDGTRVVEVGLTISDRYTSTRFSYPTPWLEYLSEYVWEGILPTSDRGPSPACATATDPAHVILSNHPEYPQPKEVSPDKEDPQGRHYVPLWVPVDDVPDKAWFDMAFPKEPAFTSCESIRRKPVPTEYSAAKFVFDTTTVFTPHMSISDGIVIVQPTASGWESTTEVVSVRPPAPHTETPVSGWSDFPSTETEKPQMPVIQPTESGWEQPAGASIINNPANNPNGAPTQPGATPIFTYVPTIVNGQPTASPAFILPGSSATASIGQLVTVNGQPTVLAAPASVFALVPTIVNGAATSVPAYIISGTLTASIGQTVTMNGVPTVLTAPAPYLTMVPTTLQGIATSIPAYIISGSITAFPGQTVMVHGQPTVLAAPSLTFTRITTTLNGHATVISAYIIDGSITATIGPTAPVYVSTTALSDAMGTEAVDTIFGGPASTSSHSQAQSTGAARGASGPRMSVGHSAALLGIGGLLIMWL